MSNPQPPGGQPPYQPQQLSHPADLFICQRPLGALYSPAGTTFRVFAPTANKVSLHLYESPVGGQGSLRQGAAGR